MQIVYGPRRWLIINKHPLIRLIRSLLVKSFWWCNYKEFHFFSPITLRMIMLICFSQLTTFNSLMFWLKSSLNRKWKFVQFQIGTNFRNVCISYVRAFEVWLMMTWKFRSCTICTNFPMININRNMPIRKRVKKDMNVCARKLRLNNGHKY